MQKNSKIRASCAVELLEIKYLLEPKTNRGGEIVRKLDPFLETIVLKWWLEGRSSRWCAEQLKERFGVEISHVAIHRRFRRYEKQLAKRLERRKEEVKE